MTRTEEPAKLQDKASETSAAIPFSSLFQRFLLVRIALTRHRRIVAIRVTIAADSNGKRQREERRAHGMNPTAVCHSRTICESRSSSARFKCETARLGSKDDAELQQTSMRSTQQQQRAKRTVQAAIHRAVKLSSMTMLRTPC